MKRKEVEQISLGGAGSAPISKVVIFFMENHTVDNLASDVPGVRGDPSLPPAPDVVIHDPPHGHADWMVRHTPAPGGARRERYSARQLPALYQLMTTFTVCDNYFSDYAGNSFANHCFAIGADAEWASQNPGHRYQFTVQTPGLPARLEKARRTWANYGKGFAFAQYKDAVMHGNVRTQGRFLADAKAGRLPNVSWVYGPQHQDFHPGPISGKGDGSSMKASDAWLRSAVKAIASGKDWGKVMIFITFDDWGGWADQVDPPLVEKFPKGTAFQGEQYRYGSRVPCVVVGPYAKSKHVSHELDSHTSLVAFVERLWQLPPSPNADARRRTKAANGMADCYDFKQKPLNPPRF